MLVCSCAVAFRESTAEYVTLLGNETQALHWQQGSAFNSSSGVKYVGLVYNNVPPLTLKAGDILAFDASLFGSSSFKAKVHFAPCVPRSREAAQNAEGGFDVLCADRFSIKDNETVLVFDGTVAAAKKRYTVPASPTFEVKLVLQQEYRHSGGHLIVVLSSVSQPRALQNLTTALTTDSSGSFGGTFLDDSALYDRHSKSTHHSQVPVVQFMPFYPLVRNETLTIADGQTFIETGVMTSKSAIFAQLKCQDDGPGRLIEINTGQGRMSTPSVNSIGNGWISSAVLDADGDFVYLGTASVPPKVMRMQTSNLTILPRASDTITMENATGEVSFVVHERGFLYVGINSYPAKVMKIGVNGSLRIEGEIELSPTELMPKAAAVDTRNAVLFLGLLGTSPGRVVMITLEPFQRFDSFDVPENLDGITSIVIDKSSSYMLLTTNTQPGHVLRVQLSDVYGSGVLAVSAKRVESLVRETAVSAFNMTWETAHPWETQNASWKSVGYIHDGGNDMYDSGNFISTSAADCTPVEYGQHFKPMQSNCFGTDDYKMSLLNGVLVFYARNGVSNGLEFRIRGNLGADSHGKIETYNFSSGNWTGFIKSVCNSTESRGGVLSTNAAVHHLTVVDTSASVPVHTWGNSTDSDEDTISNIGMGSPIVYLLYSDEKGNCWSRDQHLVLFAQARLQSQQTRV